MLRIYPRVHTCLVKRSLPRSARQQSAAKTASLVMTRALARVSVSASEGPSTTASSLDVGSSPGLGVLDFERLRSDRLPGLVDLLDFFVGLAPDESDMEVAEWKGSISSATLRLRSSIRRRRDTSAGSSSAIRSFARGVAGCFKLCSFEDNRNLLLGLATLPI